MRFKKERQEFVFRIQSNIYHRPFLRKQLRATSFIVDILPGFKYPSDEQKPTLKTTTLGIRMCSTELLLWKNQKSLTCYPITLFKWDSIAEIFLEIFNFFGQAFSRNSSKPLIVKDFYLLRMSNYYCFRGIPEKWDVEPRTFRRDPQERS